jgi:hypothetical protein
MIFWLAFTNVVWVMERQYFSERKESAANNSIKATGIVRLPFGRVIAPAPYFYRSAEI